MKNIWRTAVSALLLALLTGCEAVQVVQTESPLKIGLLAPFEGRYREVGYQALYAAQLALTDTEFNLLAVDDGGTAATAADRARALADDPSVQAVIVAGYAATAPDTLRAFGEMPVFIAGYWGSQRAYTYANPAIRDVLTVSARIALVEAADLTGPVVGGEVFALEGFTRLYDELKNIQIASSAPLPDADFIRRYAEASPFAPAPNLIATMTYQTTRALLDELSGRANFNRAALPLYLYAYDADGRLVLADDIIE